MQYLSIMLTKDNFNQINRGMRNILAYIGANGKLPDFSDENSLNDYYKKGVKLVNSKIPGLSKTSIRRMVFSYKNIRFLCIGNHYDDRVVWKLHKRKVIKALVIMEQLLSNLKNNDPDFSELYNSICQMLTKITALPCFTTNPGEVVGFPYYSELTVVPLRVEGYNEGEIEASKRMVDELNLLGSIFV